MYLYKDVFEASIISLGSINIFKYFEEFGFAGGVVVSLILIMGAYVKHENKKLDKDIEKDKALKKSEESLKEMSGSVDQIERSLKEYEETINDILSKISRHQDEFKDYKQDINREFSDLKTHLRELSRDINSKR
jgi:peptidoglycan hydrolase CwlO-like protein